MSANYVYQVVAGRVGDWNNIKNHHFVDVGTGCHGYRQANLNMVGTCNQLGLTPMVISGNDGTSNCAGEDPNTVGSYLHGLGFQCVGGESTGESESRGLQNHITFETLGGSYGYGDLDPFRDWRLGAGKQPNMVAYLEPYTDYSMFVQETINVCVKAWDVGCKEVGVLIAQSKGTLQDYINIANGVIAARGKFSGFCVWDGCDYSTDDIINSTWGIVSGLQARFPPDTRTMAQRFAGGPTPTPTPLTCPSGQHLENGKCVPNVTPITPTPKTASSFSGFHDLDVTDFLSKAHNGQPLPGQHSVEIFLPTSGQKATINLTVRARGHQPGYE